jgi:aryl-alcohol dehydrogenase-like predicted oxidoreductase
MEQTYLGSSGLVVSELCLGTMTFGGKADLDASRQIVERFREAGGTFFDTADVYTEGRSEEFLGKVIGGDRDQVVIATKGFGSVGPGMNDRSSSRRHLVQAVDASLRRLGTDYIDLYQLHVFDPTTPLEESLETLDDLVHSGKVHYVGISNFVGWQLERARRIQDARGLTRMVSLQPQYSLIERGIELETLPAARANNLGILAWSPLAAGFLTGKYRRDGSSDDPGRFVQWLEGVDERAWDVLDEARAIAEAHGSSPAAVALAWLLAQRFVIPVVGATRTDHLDDILPACDLDLGPDELRRLTEAGEPRRGYPWDFGSTAGRPPRRLRSP